MPRSYTYAQKVRKILRIALPSGANSLLDTLVLALGIFFVGRFGEEYIAALSVGMQFVMMFFAINAVFYIGTNAQISRLYGERNSERAGRVFSTLMLLCLACGAPILALAWFGLEPFIAWIGISEHTGALSKAFLMISIFSLPAVLLKNIIVSAFSAIGDTLSIFLVRIATTAFCVVINYALIIAAQLDIIGAA
ncbi:MULTISPECIES: MATE family efflux transporter [unclassified Helicobacter]|uniref:MATE family efflux transporter n=1 Tax=unclassified Helicobacter TaxID=2593540 RepID=UPI000B031BDC|nr:MULTISPECIES: MATE family efflux transporter [unclassified Helicobacter]